MWRFVDRDIYERQPSGIRIIPLPRRTQILMAAGLAALVGLSLLLLAATVGLFVLWQQQTAATQQLQRETAPVAERVAAAVARATRELEEERARLQQRLAQLEADLRRTRETLETRLQAAELHAAQLAKERETLASERAELAARLERLSLRVAEMPAGEGATTAGRAAREDDGSPERLRHRAILEGLRRHLNAALLAAALARREREQNLARSPSDAGAPTSSGYPPQVEAELAELRAQRDRMAEEAASLRTRLAELERSNAAARDPSRGGEAVAAALARAEAAEAAAATLAADLEAARRKIRELEQRIPSPAGELPTAEDDGEPSRTLSAGGLFGTLAPQPPRPAPR